MIRVVLDEVVAHTTPGRPRSMDIETEFPVSVEALLRSAGIPVGLIAYVVRGDRVLDLDDVVTGGDETLEIYGIYDGG